MYQQRKSEEQAACQAIREQLKSAYGLLTDLFKADPSRAERYFLRFRKPPKKKEEKKAEAAPKAA